MASTECNQFDAIHKSEGLPLIQNSFNEQLKDIESVEALKVVEGKNNLSKMIDKLLNFQKQFGENQTTTESFTEKQEEIKKMYE